MNRSVSFFLFASLVGIAGCGSSIRRAMIGAPVAPNPMVPGARLYGTPVASSAYGGAGGMLAIISADANEVCFNGEIRDTAESVEKYRFKMQSFKTRDDDEDQVATADSRSVKVLVSMGNPDAGRSVTDFQACFPNPNVFTAQTVYLVVKRDPLPFLAKPFNGIWHFDDSIKKMDMSR